MRKLTARTIQPGGMYFNERLGHMVHVRDTHVGLYCEKCFWDVAMPKRFGKTRIEQTRKDHIGTVHWDDLVSGQMQLSEQELELCPTEPSS